jgi:hypothetical protein
MNRAEIDRLIDEHFGYEAADDVGSVVASLTEDAEHHVIPSPVGILDDRKQIQDYYRTLFRCIRGEKVTPVRRLYGDDFVVDEAIWQGHVEDGGIFLCEGKRGPVSFRILHVFEFRDGQIRRENVWCDLAAIQRQLGVELC